MATTTQYDLRCVAFSAGRHSHEESRCAFPQILETPTAQQVAGHDLWGIVTCLALPSRHNAQDRFVVARQDLSPRRDRCGWRQSPHPNSPIGGRPADPRVKYGSEGCGRLANVRRAWNRGRFMPATLKPLIAGRLRVASFGCGWAYLQTATDSGA